MSPTVVVFKRYAFAMALLAAMAVIFAGSCINFARVSTLKAASVNTVHGWPWFEDSYFNLTFQYPPEWKVERVDVTNYYDDSAFDLAGESAAVAGPDKHKTWILRIVPPYDDVQEIHRGKVGAVHSAIVIEQPNIFHGNNRFYSTVFRPKHREYESALDPYGEDFRFNFSHYASFANGIATTSISFGRSPGGAIAGITALKVFPLNYHFQAYMTMTDDLGHTEDNILTFTRVIDSLRLLCPETRYDERNYQIPVLPTEYNVRSSQIGTSV